MSKIALSRNLPEQIGSLTVIRIEGPMVHLRCTEGHESTRLARRVDFIVRHGLGIVCTQCVRPATGAQRELLALLKGGPLTPTEACKSLGKSIYGTIYTCESKGFVTNKGGKLYITDDGLKQLS